MSNQLRTPSATELYHVHGEPDAEGLPKKGVTLSTNLTKTWVKVLVKYQDKILEGQLYQFGNEPPMVNFYCPRCLHSIKIEGHRKNIDFDLSDLREVHPDLPKSPRISIEPFRCCWELGERNHERMQFGLSLCGWTVGIDNNIAKDA